jgi:hypothetical protein
MDVFIDVKFSLGGSVQELSRILNGFKYGLVDISLVMNRDAGEYRIGPVSLKVFDTWAARHPQFPYGIQYDNNLVVVTIVLPPHDRSAAIIVQHITRLVDRMCTGNDANFWSGTGCMYPLFEVSDEQ